MVGKMRLRPWEIDRMIIPEIETALMEDLETPVEGRPVTSLQEQMEYAAWYRSLTWKDKIQMARDS